MRAFRLMMFPTFLYFGLPCFAAGPLPTDLGPAEYYRPPQLTLMTGFIKDPQHSGFEVDEWARSIGKNFDAKKLVSRVKQAGFAQIIWYDKWIDGLVFRRTKTTSYVTERDFLGELAPECKRQGIKLVIYFNTFYDGNPEFERWACVDQRGKPVSFSPFWPLNLLSMYSPFREKALEQIRELLVDYDVDGIWLDVPSYGSFCYDEWSREAFKKQFGKPMEQASAMERQRFSIRSARTWNKEVAAFIRRVKPEATVTTNGFPDPLAEGPLSAIHRAEPLNYFSSERHSNDLQLQSAPILSELIKPVEVGTLISDDWFTPLNSGPLKSSKDTNQMHLELATVLGGGTNMYLALALAHDGTAHEYTLKWLDLAGEWLKARRSYLEGTENFTDVGIAFGTADPDELYWPGAKLSYGAQILALEENLRQRGHLVRRLMNAAHVARWDRCPPEMRVIVVPDRDSFASADADRVRRFVQDGGRVVAFARGMSLAEDGTSADPLFGVESAGYIVPLPGKTLLTVPQAEESIDLTAAVVHLRPSTADVLLWGTTRREGQMPVLTRRRVGKGFAYTVAVSESDMLANEELTGKVWSEVLGEPLWKVDDESGRYVAAIRRQKNRLILHFMDTLSTSEGPMRRYRPLYTKVRLNGAQIPFSRATIVPDNRKLDIASEGEWKGFQVYADPELTIVLE